MSEKRGQEIVLGVGVYLILKSILNLILNFGAENVFYLILFIVLAVLLGKKTQYTRLVSYITAGLLVLLFLVNLGNNLSNFGSNWIYFLEGLLDIGCAALLLFQKDVKNYLR